MENYEAIFKTFIEKYSQNGYSNSLCSSYYNLLAAATSFFSRKGVYITEESIQKFTKNYSVRVKKIYCRILRELAIFNATGFVKHKQLRPLLKLDTYYLLYLDNYLTNTFSNKKYRNSIRNMIVPFFETLQHEQIKVSDINYIDCMRVYKELDLPLSVLGRDNFDQHVRGFLHYISDIGINKRKLWIVFNHWNPPYLFSVEKLSRESKEELSSIRKFHFKTRSELWDSIDSLKIIFENCGYAKKNYAGLKRTIELLYAFFDMNDMDYSIEYSWIWFNEIEKKLKTDRNWFKRTVNIIELFFQDEISTSSTFIPKRRLFIPQIEYLYRRKTVKRESIFNKLTPYYQSLIKAFQNYKRLEGRCEKTLKEYQYGLQKFTMYLISRNILNIKDLTRDVLSDFISSDFNDFPGKLVKIRMFLYFLYETRLMTTDLSVCVPVKTASKEKIVTVLNRNELLQIDNYRKNCKSASEYKNAAGVLLGLFMGLRACDVANLKFNDIDWQNKVLHLVQTKTKVQLDLPIPNPVYEAVVLYIKNGRPKANSPYIFLEDNPPFKKIGYQSGKYMIKGVLKNRINFHILRRTFASNIHETSKSLNTVINCLGHTGETSVGKYVNISKKMMEECTLSLSDLHI